MQFAARLLTLSAAITQALAVVSLTNSNWDVTEGKAFDITWTGANGAVTLLLKDGPSKNLATVTTIASGLTGTSFSWTPSNLPSGTYAVEIDDSSDTNYGSQFVYSGTGVATTASTAATTTASSTVSSESTTTTGSTSTTESSSAATTLSTSASSNGTSTASSTASHTTKSSSTSGTSTGSTATSTPLDTNDSQRMGSPLALVLLTFAALTLCH